MTFKEFWQNIGNWWMNEVIRMEGATKAIVLPLLLAIAFFCWYRMFKGAKKDMKSFKSFPYLWFITGALVFALAMWIIAGS